jgi:hypothetical protein
VSQGIKMEMLAWAAFTPPEGVEHKCAAHMPVWKGQVLYRYLIAKHPH